MNELERKKLKSQNHRVFFVRYRRTYILNNSYKTYVKNMNNKIIILIYVLLRYKVRLWTRS